MRVFRDAQSVFFRNMTDKGDSSTIKREKKFDRKITKFGSQLFFQTNFVCFIFPKTCFKIFVELVV